VTSTDDPSYTKTLTTTSTSASVTDLIPGYDYQCVVQAYGTVGSIRTYSTAVNITANVLPSTPTNFKATTYVSNYGVTLSWDVDESCSGYRLYRAEDVAGPYTLIKTLTDYNDGGTDGTYTYNDVLTVAAAGKTYYYKIESYINALGAQYPSPATDPVFAHVLPPRPTNVKTTSAGMTSISLTWNAVNGADGYYIYRSDKSGTGYTHVASVDAATTNYTDTDVISGVKYYYQVRAIKDVVIDGEAVVVVGTPSAEVIGQSKATSPTNLSAVVNAKSIVLKWDAMTDVNGYIVYLAKEGDATFTQMARIGTTTYTLTGLDVATKYHIRVAGYRHVNGEDVVGNYAELTRTTAIPTMAKPKAEYVDGTSLKISWNKVTDAEGYELWRFDDITGKYVRIATLSSSTTSYTATGLDTGTYYYFKIRAFVKKNNVQVNGTLSDSVREIVLPKPPTGLRVVNCWKQTMDISWTAADYADGYRIEYSADGGATWKPFKVLMGNGITQYRMMSLTPGATYKIRVYTLTTTSLGGYFWNKNAPSNTLTVTMRQ